MKLSDEIRKVADNAKAGTLKVFGTAMEEWADRTAELERKLAAWEALEERCREEGAALAFPGNGISFCADWDQEEASANSPRLLCVNLGIDGFSKNG